MKQLTKWIRHNQGLFVALIIVMLTIPLTLVGCQRGDFRVSLVVEGQPAPHAGYNVGPDLYVEQGDPVPVSGAVIWIRGLDPNNLR